MEAQQRSDFVAMDDPGDIKFHLGGSVTQRYATLCQCPTCLLCVVVYVKSDNELFLEEPEYCSISNWAPLTVEKIDERLPEPFKKDLKEAAYCLSVKASNATAMMCRRIVSQLAIGNGADPTKTTGPQLKYLREKGLIDEKLLNAAYGIKSFGDDGAHPPDDVGLEEAKKVFRVTERILYYALILDEEL